MIEILNKYTGNSVKDSSGSYSFIELVNKVKEYDAFFEKKILHDDRVVIYSDYNFFSISVLVCLSKFKINIIPIVKTTDQELSEKMLLIKPTKIITFDNENRMHLKIIPENLKIKNADFNSVTTKGDTGIVLFSSGTTGKPKMMIQNFSKLIKSVNIPRKQKSLTFIIFLMFDHIGGINSLLNCLLLGAPMAIPSDRKPSTVIKLIKDCGANVLPTTPTFLNLLMIDENFNQENVPSLKLITYGTERMPNVLLKKLNLAFPKVKILQTFGTSETGILKTISKSSGSLFFKIVDNDREFKIVDGELYLKSKTSVSGYINDSNDNFKADGWYATGDIVEQDDEGYIKIIARKNNIINVGGLKVFPQEVENVINNVPGVIDSSVYGEKNSIIGNIVCAKVYSMSNDKKSLKNSIKKFCKNRLENYKVPIKIIFDELKITERGKKDN